MVFARDRDGQRQSRLQSDASAEEAVSDLVRAVSALPGLSRTMQIVPGSSRMFAGVCGLLCGVVFALAIPRMGPWALTLTLPFCVGAGFVWGHRVRAKESRDALDKLKARLAHELNNPLAILIDQLDSAVSELERTSLTQGLRRAPELKALADDALAAASRIARVVRDLDETAPIAIERPSSQGRAARAAHATKERLAPAKSGPIPKPARARILVIDDEPQVAASLRRMLYRHDVTVATTGFEAQSLIQHYEFDVIVSDVMMPEPSGMDVFERLTRTDPELARRFVFVTGGTYTSQARDFLASIPNARLGKPVDALALDRAIAEIHQGLELSATSNV